MPEEHDREERKKLEQEIWSAITAFEKILEAMPNDMASLEALAHAYEQVGDHARAKDYLVRLGDVLVEESDVEGTQALVEKLTQFAEEDPRVKELMARIEQLAHAPQPREVAGGDAHGPPVTLGEQPFRATFNMADELSFAWKLLQSKELSEEEYASVVQDLSEMSATDSNTTISVLHALEFRASKSLDRIMGYVARDCGVPIVSLSSFGFPVEAMTALSMERMVRRGALVFGFIGPDAMVVVMNPYNSQLRSEVEATLGRHCHFYICLPSEFDQALTRIRNQLEERAASEAGS
jgi:hypothetical protein